ncbi:hypothetical protein BOO92_13740 [Vibrio navarrensis]|uniref:hypothetical protein n=1 Tax=Vibrio navarrensis TaxID=29495 RepID=UPI0018688972|nr:hypothetical protein [Vibrio navarrensis]EHA1127439.1 hypothetical protein [Vibrio navarrensis]MBE3657739.1 hypothetical protein [Vibrio navarrensis]HDY8121294.1 hypothetical protein [Vibrio vulnificus]
MLYYLWFMYISCLLLPFTGGLALAFPLVAWIATKGMGLKLDRVVKTHINGIAWLALSTTIAVIVLALTAGIVGEMVYPTETQKAQGNIVVIGIAFVIVARWYWQLIVACLSLKRGCELPKYRKLPFTYRRVKKIKESLSVEGDFNGK